MYSILFITMNMFYNQYLLRMKSCTRTEHLFYISYWCQLDSRKARCFSLGLLGVCQNCNKNVPLFQIGLDTNYWTAVNHFFIWGSLAVYFAIMFAMTSDGIFQIFPSQFPFVGKWGTSQSRLTNQGLPCWYFPYLFHYRPYYWRTPKASVMRSLCFVAGTARNTLSQKSVWLVILLTTVVCTMPVVAMRFLKTDLHPTQTDKASILE